MITQERLKELFNYDPLVGLFIRKVSRPSCKKGSIAGTDNKGYVKICVDKKRFFAHRLAWMYMYGEWPRKEIDHLNHIKDDNRIINLRDVSRSDNARNFPLFLTNTSGYSGLYFNKKKKRWVVQLLQKVRKEFENKKEAIIFCKKMKKELGFHKNHGIVCKFTAK